MLSWLLWTKIKNAENIKAIHFFKRGLSKYTQNWGGQIPLLPSGHPCSYMSPSLIGLFCVSMAKDITCI